MKDAHLTEAEAVDFNIRYQGEILGDALWFPLLVPGVDLVGGLLSFLSLGVDSFASHLGLVFLSSWMGVGRDELRCWG